MKISQGFLSV